MKLLCPFKECQKYYFFLQSAFVWNVFLKKKQQLRWRLFSLRCPLKITCAPFCYLAQKLCLERSSILKKTEERTKQTSFLWKGVSLNVTGMSLECLLLQAAWAVHTPLCAISNHVSTKNLTRDRKRHLQRHSDTRPLLPSCLQLQETRP